MTHIVAGYPTMDECEQIAKTMIDSEVAYLEIQIPFSDPNADGPTIMQANQIALDNGTTPNDAFDLMRRLKAYKEENQLKTELLFMTYFNILYSYGVEKFCLDAKEAGAWGLIVPDIPFDEDAYEGYLANCEKHRLNPIQIISPITPDERLKEINEVAKGFVYCVSRKGTTGVQQELSPELMGYIENVKRLVNVPLAVGFGISRRGHVESVLKYADLAVIGSQIINLYNASNDDKKLSSVSQFLEQVG